MSSTLPEPNAEWLEADGRGGFASGTVAGQRSRRYHALLLTASVPPTGRLVMVNGFDAWVTTRSGRFAISSQRYQPGVTHPDGASRLESFTTDPWPRWRWRLADGTQVEQELFVPRDNSAVAIRWRLSEPRDDVQLEVRPFFSGRDYHSLHHENPAFRFEPQQRGERLVWKVYEPLPAVVAVTNGQYQHQPDWYRNFLYEEEQSRGLDCAEDLASPGGLTWELSSADAVLLLFADGHADRLSASELPATQLWQALRDDEDARRARFPSPLERAADAYLVTRGAGKTIVAGYPWFTDWGRDTFIALRGLCLATGRLDDAREILLAWADTVSEGMLPNRFPDHGDQPEFNSVDASLWYVVAVHEFFGTSQRTETPVWPADRKKLQDAVESILDGYRGGTRFNIRLDDDYLLAAGQPGTQLTWMDAKVSDWVVTPRIGKPVEVQALWLNALWAASRFSDRWKTLFDRGHQSFYDRFWNETAGCLYDVIDVDHQRGKVDAAFRPNQIFAVGGLPLGLLQGSRAWHVVEAVESRLWTPLGPRSLAPDSPGYAPRYEGGVWQRDGAYHQGTVWPWLAGPFVEAWVRVRGDSASAKHEARQRFVEPLLTHRHQAGLGHISEIADAEPPHAPRGCPFQAWSLGELLRLIHVVLAETSTVDEQNGVIVEPAAAV